MRRREFVTVLGGAVVAWPLAARAQQVERMRRIGVLMNTQESDPEWRRETAAFVKQIETLLWNVGSNVLIDYRFGAGDPDRMAAFAKELVGLRPDVILARSTPAVKAVLSETRTIPIVFVSVSDPVGDGLAASVARPGGNVTGFTNVEASMGGKWLELLKEIAPRTRTVAVLFNPKVAPGGGSYYLRTIEVLVPAFGVSLTSYPVDSATDIEAAMAAHAREPDSALLGMPDPFISAHRGLTIELAARYRLPAVYGFRNFAVEGGLMSYGVDIVDLYRRSATYVSGILKGEKPADLPVQAPTKFELVINLKTAKALGLEVPPTLLARADEVIE
jgi:putative ABC transport system substrate-binding protein